MVHKTCLLLLLPILLMDGRAISAEEMAPDTVQGGHPPLLQLGMGVGMMKEKTGISYVLGAWLPRDWPLLGFFFNYSNQINGSFGGSMDRGGDSMGDLAVLVGARDRGKSGWISFALGPAYFWETRLHSATSHTDLSGPGLEAVTSFGWAIGRGGLGFSFNFLLGSETRRLAIRLVGEIPLSE